MLAEFSATEGRELNLLCKVIGGREIAVAVDEHAPDYEDRIARRGYLLHAARHLSVPAGTGDQVIVGVCAGGARADVAEVDVEWIGELHAVIAAGEVGHVQDLRPVGEVKAADRKQGVVVHADGHQVRTSRRERCAERLRKQCLRLRIQRIDRDRAVAEPLVDDRFSEVVVHEVRPEVDEENRADQPRHNHDRAESHKMLVLHRRCHCVSTTGGTSYAPSRMALPGRYTRSQSMKSPDGAGSQLDSWPAGVAVWM